MSKYKSIAVIGAGTMGSGIAHTFAQFGFDVHLFDSRQTAVNEALELISANMGRQEAKGILSGSQKQESISRILAFQHLEEAVFGVELVVEAVAEDESAKKLLFTRLDTICKPEVLLLSNTSSVSITALAAATRRADRVAGMHFMNPVPVMSLVEVVKGLATSGETVGMVTSLATQLGKVPVVVNDYPGFVSNRILMPMINEAIITLEQKVAGVEQIDTIMKLGMSHPMGPLQLADYIGLDICLNIMEVLYKGFGHSRYAPCVLLKNMVSAGYLGAKSGNGFYEWSDSGKKSVVSALFR